MIALALESWRSGLLFGPRPLRASQNRQTQHCLEPIEFTSTGRRPHLHALGALRIGVSESSLTLLTAILCGCGPKPTLPGSGTLPLSDTSTAKEIAVDIASVEASADAAVPSPEVTATAPSICANQPMGKACIDNVDCGANHVCTKLHGCQPFALTCVGRPDCTPCDDRLLCVEGGYCQAGKCAGGKVLNCDDGLPCTADTCDAKQGCQHKWLKDVDPALCHKEVCSNGLAKLGTRMEEKLGFVGWPQVAPNGETLAVVDLAGPSQGDCKLVRLSTDGSVRWSTGALDHGCWLTPLVDQDELWHPRRYYVLARSGFVFHLKALPGQSAPLQVVRNAAGEVVSTGRFAAPTTDGSHIWLYTREYPGSASVLGGYTLGLKPSMPIFHHTVGAFGAALTVPDLAAYLALLPDWLKSGPGAPWGYSLHLRASNAVVHDPQGNPLWPAKQFIRWNIESGELTTTTGPAKASPCGVHWPLSPEQWPGHGYHCREIAIAGAPNGTHTVSIWRYPEMGPQSEYPGPRRFVTARTLAAGGSDELFVLDLGEAAADWHTSFLCGSPGCIVRSLGSYWSNATVWTTPCPKPNAVVFSYDGGGATCLSTAFDGPVDEQSPQYSGPNSLSPQWVTWGPDGTIVSLFHRVENPKVSPLVRSTTFVTKDIWGHKTCEEAGICYGKSIDDCSDGNRCTWETCDPKAGCQHHNVPDGTLCGNGKLCKGGKCG